MLFDVLMHSKYGHLSCFFSLSLSHHDFETSAFESLYGGQFTLSTQLMKPNYLIQTQLFRIPRYLELKSIPLGFALQSFTISYLERPLFRTSFVSLRVGNSGLQLYLLCQV